MERWLVAGGAGFIGSNFVRMLLDGDRDVLVVNLDKLTYAGDTGNLGSAMDDPRHIFVRGDIRDAGLVRRLFDTYRFGRVVNFAAESHVDRSISDPDAFAGTNTFGASVLMRCAMDAWRDDPGGRKFAQVSTDEVYGSLGPEGLFTESSPLAPRSPYAASKAGADCMALAFHNTYGFPVVVTRCSNNYGPRQHPEKLVPLTISKAAAGVPVPVYGDGLQVRDWIHVSDHCRAIMAAVASGRLGEVYNIGARNERTNISIVSDILRLTGRLPDGGGLSGLMEYISDRPGHDRRYAIDPSKAERELGWRAEVRFGDGLAETVAWYMDRFREAAR